MREIRGPGRLATPRCSRRDVAVLALAAALAAAACEPPPASPPPAAGPRAGLLGAEAFGLPAARHHAPEARIGEETREVLAAAKVVRIADARRLTPRGGVVRIALAAPTSMQPRLRRSLVVSRPAVMADLAAEMRRAGGAGLHHQTLIDDWRLEPSSDEAGALSLIVPVPDPGRRRRHHIVVDRMESLPERLESVPLGVEPGTRLLLAFGATDLPGRLEQLTARFAATLRCADREPRSLLAETLTVGKDPDPGWQQRRIDLPDDAVGCRLRLDTSAEAAELGVAVWGVPRLLPPAEPSEAPSLILVSLDTLRADHLSGYGYARETSPRIDRELIARGTSFTQASSTYPLTHAAHLSLMSGLYAGAQPVLGTAHDDSAIGLLAEVLRDAGMLTQAFTEDGYVSTHYGFSHGFLRWVEHPLSPTGRGEQVFAEGREFLRRHRGERFFLFLHTYKVHVPYSAGPGYAKYFADGADWHSGRLDPHVPEEQRLQVDLYDRAIRQLDDQLGPLLDEIERLGLGERTFVVVVSDHGEAFGEHGVKGHGFGAHEEQLRVPFIVRGPGVAAGRRVDTPVSLVDVTPTLLDLLGLPPLAQAQGVSLRAALAPEGEVADEIQERPVFFSWIGRQRGGVRAGPWKLLAQEGRGQLYDLSRDPHERAPVPAADRTRTLDELLEAHLSESRSKRSELRAAASEPAVRPAPEELEQSLRALGYIE